VPVQQQVLPLVPAAFVLKQNQRTAREEQRTPKQSADGRMKQ
jgi:hypothetical protein